MRLRLKLPGIGRTPPAELTTYMFSRPGSVGALRWYSLLLVERLNNLDDPLSKVLLFSLPVTQRAGLLL